MFSAYLEQLFWDSGAHEGGSVPPLEPNPGLSLDMWKTREECSAFLALLHWCLGHVSSGEMPSLVHAGMTWIDAPSTCREGHGLTRPTPTKAGNS